jgi:iron complex outermembrane receptor protein
LGLLGDDRLDFNALYTYTTKYRTQDDPAAPNYNGVGNLFHGEVFKHKVNANLLYSLGAFSINWNVTYLSKMVFQENDEFDPEGTYAALTGPSIGLTPAQAERLISHNYIKQRFYHSAQLRADVGERKQFGVFVGVDNIFDRKPPILEDSLFTGGVSITGTTTAADVYDPYGRRFYAGVQVKF